VSSQPLSRRSTVASRLILVALLVGFMIALVVLLQARMTRGNVYAPYSSLRVDPLGSKALFEALGLADSYTSERNIEGLERLSAREWESADRTVLFLGVDAESGWSDLEATSRRLAAEGARVVLALRPAQASASLSDESEGDEEESASEPPEIEVGNSSAGQPLQPLKFERFATDRETTVGDAVETEADSEKPGVGVEPTPEISNSQAIDFPTESLAHLAEPGVDRVASGPNLPATIEWRSAWFVDEPPASWRVVYRLRDKPVVLTRRVGHGEIVLLTDSFPFSNEALASGVPVDLLRWILGEGAAAESSMPRHVLFDEGHLGYRSASGLIALAKRYRLGGFFAALAVVAGLFVWHASAVLARPAPSVRASTLNTELPSSSALLSVLDRGLPGGELLKACTQSWQGSQGRHVSSELRAEIRSLAESSSDPIAGYRKIRQRLQEASHPQRDPSDKGVS